jgi:aspartate racemase
MKAGRCLGLIGGLGVGATVHYYKELAKTHEEAGRALNIVITHAQIARVREYVEVNNRGALAEYLIGFIGTMKAAGAEIAAVPAVMPHMCVRELVAASSLPIFNIFEPLVHELNTRAIRRVAVFGTRFVIESGLFGFAGDIEIVQPRAKEVDFIHETYMELAQRGEGTRKQRDDLTALAHTFIERDGVDTIVLAGTDLVLLFNDTNKSFPFVDCAALHIAAITNGLLSETPSRR